MPKAGIELVILTIGRELQIIDQEIFSAMVLMVVVSILISPACMKWVIRQGNEKVGSGDKLWKLKN